VQNLSDLLNSEQALLLEDLDDVINVLMTHGENLRANVKYPL
jgi:hypothetical protein